MAEFKVDQSGKWETSGATAIGVQGPRNYSLLVDRHVKQEVLSLLRKMSQVKNPSKTAFNIRAFAYTVFLALAGDFRKGDTVIIDEEYEGQEDRIKDILVSLFERRLNLPVPIQAISFGRVDRTTIAHSIAKQTLLGARRPENARYWAITMICWTAQ